MNIKVFYRFLKYHDELCIVGSDSSLGNWDTSRSLRMEHLDRFVYSVDIEPSSGGRVEYKFIVKSGGKIYWQSGCNNSYDNCMDSSDCIFHKELVFENYNPKFSGVVAPVFSLRHKYDWGIGDFMGLRMLVDFADRTNMSVVQILPVNDTCITMTDKDSYPYNAISSNAINPMYMDMSCFENRNKTALDANQLPKIDYGIVSVNKYLSIWDCTESYISDKNKLEALNDFSIQNNSWLDAYAKFIITNDTAGIFTGRLQEYDKTCDSESFESFFEEEILRIKSIQYILYRQLKAVSGYAYEKNIMLKGDLPIGVNPDGLDVSVNRRYFYTEFSAGAPPDDFACDGQNWGFPTYNWDVMESDGFVWWKNRMSSLSSYFSAIRIDHILGFFRIWQIPENQNSGLLGFFNPSIPLDYNTINEGLNEEWDIECLSRPIVHKDYAKRVLGTYFDYAIECGLLSEHGRNGFFTLKETTQKYYDKAGDEMYGILKHLCTEVLFIKHQNNYYPRIMPYKTEIFKHIGTRNQAFIQDVANKYFYIQNVSLWKSVARKRLEAIKSSSDMLLCAEDLGMIPSCVPNVLSDLNIMTLEIERMPKEGQETPWCNLGNLPYNSVLSTSTHDMPPLKLYWRNMSDSERNEYRKRKLDVFDIADEKKVLKNIIMNHLRASSMFCIIPLGDILSFSDVMSQDAAEEQINHPENPNNVWDYRFPFYMDDLLEDNSIVCEISDMILETERCK